MRPGITYLKRSFKIKEKPGKKRKVDTQTATTSEVAALTQKPAQASPGGCKTEDDIMVWFSKQKVPFFQRLTFEKGKK